MTAARCLVLLLAALPFTMARATGPTSEEDLLASLAAQVAPFTLSVDGQVRLNVDARHVLHRVPLADSARERRVVLPFAVRALAASRTGQKVAVRSDPGCVGLVDFGAPGATTAPTLRWLDASFPDNVDQPARTPEPWSEQAPPNCAPTDEQAMGTLRWPTLALSVDGRLLATEYQVVDTESHRLVASLRGTPMRVRFLDGGRRLLSQGIVMSSGYESRPHGLSEVNLAVWNLADGSLAGVQRRRLDQLSPAAVSLQFASDSSPAAWVLDDASGPSGVPLQRLHRWDATACGGQADAGVAIAPFGRPVAPASVSIDAIVVDPLERWVATFRSVAEGQGSAGELVVQALADGRVLSRRPLAAPVASPVATPDGTRLLAWAWDPADPPAGNGLPPSGDAVVAFPVDVQGLAPVAAASAAAACGVDGAAPSALDVSRPVHVLTPSWRQVFPAAAPRRLATGDAAPAAPACTAPDLFDLLHSSVFFGPDGRLWLDRFSTLAEIEPGTGKTLRTGPTPRGPQVCSTVSPTADGYFNIQGDTFTWRPLEAGTAARRVIDRRPGWTATEVLRVGRAVYVGWRAQEGVVRPAGDAAAQDFVVALHDARGRLLRQQAQSFASAEYAGDAAAPLYEETFMPACADAAGPIVDAVAWQVDVFDSLRARACGGAGTPARTLLWTDTDIVARPGTPRRHAARPAVLAHDGNIAVMQDDVRLHVFDLAQRRELGQFTWAGVRGDSVAVSAARSLVVVVQGEVSGSAGPNVVVTAYRFR